MPDPLALMALGRDPLADAGPQPQNALGAEALAPIVSAIARPIGDAFGYFGRTLRGEEPLYDPATGHPSDQAYNAAGALAGLGMTGGIAGTGPGGVALGAGPIRAYHGSPYDIQRFDLSKIGTGQGMATHGRGINLSENEAIARAYRDQLARERGVPGHMYEVGVHVDPEQLIQWEKPLSEQPMQVQRMLAEHGVDPAFIRSGEDAYRQLSYVLPGGGATSALREAGVPGVRYLDEGTRGVGSGSPNLTMFDDSLVEILRKYGLLGPVAGGVAASALPGQDTRAQE